MVRLLAVRRSPHHCTPLLLFPEEGLAVLDPVWKVDVGCVTTVVSLATAWCGRRAQDRRSADISKLTRPAVSRAESAASQHMLDTDLCGGLSAPPSGER